MYVRVQFISEIQKGNAHLAVRVRVRSSFTSSFRIAPAIIGLDISGLILLPKFIIILPRHLRKVGRPGNRNKAFFPSLELTQSLLGQLPLLVHTVDFDAMTAARDVQTPIPGAPNF